MTRYFYMENYDRSKLQEVHILENYGKALVIEVYDPFEERWVQKTVNAAYVMSEDKLANLT